MSQNEDRYKQDSYSHGKKRSVMSEMIGEVPIVGEMFESLGQARIGQKGIKKLFYCCAPLALILLILMIMFVYWLIKSGLSLFKISLPDVNWIEQARNWLAGTFQFNQISQWSESLQGLVGL